MPVIHEYKQQVRSAGELNVQPDPTAAGAVGRALARTGEAAFGAGLDITESKDKSNLQAEVAKARADATQTLQQDVQSGAINADNYLESYNTRMSQAFENVGATARTRAVQDAASAQRTVLQSDFATHAQTAKITADGQQVAINFDRSLNSSGDTLLRDPTQYQAIHDQWALAMDDPSGPYAKMSAEQRAKAKEHVDENLAKWYVQGAIEKLGPEFARKELDSGKYDGLLKADTKEMLLHRADVEKRTRQEDIQRARTIQLQQEADADKQKRLNMDQRLAGDPAKWPTYKEIAYAFNDPAISERMREVLKTRLEHPDQPTNAAVFLDVQKKIFLPPGSPDRITDPAVINNLYAVNNQLSNDDRARLQVNLEEARKEDPLNHDLQTATDRVERIFATAMPWNGPDMLPVSTGAAYRWRTDVEKQMHLDIAEGKNPRDTIAKFLDPKVASTYLTFGPATVKDAADKIKAAAKLPIYPVENAEDFKKVPVGARYRGNDGVVRIKVDTPINVSDAPVPSVPGAP